MAPGSILEAPGLDFGAYKARFQRDFRICLESFSKKSFQQSIITNIILSNMPKNDKDAKNAKNANCFQSANAISSTMKAYSISMAEAKKGGRWWSPPGGYNKLSNQPNQNAQFFS